MKWFGKDQDPNLPKLVDSERTKESLNAYIDIQLSGEEPVEELDDVVDEALEKTNEEL